MIGGKISQRWLEEGPGTCAPGLLQVQRCLLQGGGMGEAQGEVFRILPAV